MRGGVSVSVHLHVRVGTTKGEVGEGLRVFSKKEGRRWKKTRAFSRKSPLVSVIYYRFERKVIFVVEKFRLFEI